MGLAKLRSMIASAGRDESGAAMVEFAISLTVLLPIFVGTIDLGLAMYRWLKLNDMAEAGALYATTNAQQLYSGPVTTGAFQYSLISSAAASAGAGLTGVTTTVVGVCSCPPTIPSSCPSATQFAGSNTPNPYCTATCTTPSESAYVCITSSYTYTPLIAVPYLPPITISARSMVKIH
jgi:Flp pilus assembly protein TadG